MDGLASVVVREAIQNNSSLLKSFFCLPNKTELTAGTHSGFHLGIFPLDGGGGGGEAGGVRGCRI